MSRGERPAPLRKARPTIVATMLLLGVATSARADWHLGVDVEAGPSVMGGPLNYRMAHPKAEEGDSTDAVTGASIDGITSASRISHAGGAHVTFRRGGTGTLSIGLEYVHYRFDLDYSFGRAHMDIVGMRIPLLARLVVARLRGEPFFHFGFGGYFELTLFDGAELGGEQREIDVEPLGFGIIVDFYLTPYRFDIERGRLAPAIFVRGYRGVVTQLRDDLGSAAPLVSITLGVSLSYELALD